MRMFLRQPIMVVVRAELYWVHSTVLNTFKGETVKQKVSKCQNMLNGVKYAIKL